MSRLRLTSVLDGLVWIFLPIRIRFWFCKKMVILRPTCVMDLVGKLQANCLSLVEPQLNPSLLYFGLFWLSSVHCNIGLAASKLYGNLIPSKQIRGKEQETIFLILRRGFDIKREAALTIIQHGGGGGQNVFRHLIGLIAHKPSKRQAWQWSVNSSLSIRVTLKKQAGSI